MERVRRTEGKIRQVRRITELRSTALGRRQPQVLGERQQSIKLINSINKWMGKEDVAHIHNGIFSSVQSLSHVRLLETPWIAAHQASLNITNSWSLLKLMSESVMPSSHLILCRPLFLLPPIPPSILAIKRTKLCYLQRCGQTQRLSHRKIRKTNTVY